MSTAFGKRKVPMRSCKRGLQLHLFEVYPFRPDTKYKQITKIKKEGKRKNLPINEIETIQNNYPQKIRHLTAK